MQLSDLRTKYLPKTPVVFKNLKKVVLEEASTHKTDPKIAELFPNTSKQKRLVFEQGSKQHFEPLKIGVVFSGGQAPGGHNVIAGLFDAIRELNDSSSLIGFLGGPIGIVNQEYSAIDEEGLEEYRNQGGFDLIASGRDKIESTEHLEKAARCVEKLGLDGLVVIGGDDSNTNAAVLAEYFAKSDLKTCVIGVPKTIDGDLKTKEIAISFGFDTACKVYSEMIGNIAKDALSARKYYHFIRVMGRSASHIALECAFQTHPNLTLVSEEVQEKKMTLQDLADQIADMVIQRSENGKNYGLVVIPEGIVEFVPEVKALIKELNDLLAEGSLSIKELEKKLSKDSFHCFSSLPESIQKQLLLDRDPHGNVQVAKIESEKMFIEMVKQTLKDRKWTGPFSAQHHYFGYEGRAALPSNFDCNLCYSLGTMAAILLAHKKTGYICALSQLERGFDHASVQAVPITSMLHIEKRKGKDKPVIAKALVELDGKPFAYFKKIRERLLSEDLYQVPGPIQFFGEGIITEKITQTLEIEST